MRTRYDDLIARLREAAHPDRPAPPEMARYLKKVRLRAYTVTGRDIDELKATFSEDEIFEHTVSAALAAGLERLDAALATLR
jgi:alkylhydroperoxidase family enzyme